MNSVFPERMLIKVHNDRFRQMFLCRIALNYRMEVNLELWMHSLPKWKQRSIVSNSKCILVVPDLIKGGFIFGGKHGRGVATCRTSSGWSAPAFVSVGGGSWGLQIGVEGVDLVMLVMNEQGFQHLLSSKFQLSGEGSAAAGPVGRHASAGTDWKMNTEMLTYSRSKGVFAGLTLEGAVVQQDDDSTRAIYSKDMTFRNILSGKVSTPKSADAFIKAVSDAGQQARIAEATEARE